ncbi:unnamed protein product [Didymodactylos carnosus]|uniref:Uncharacterized protein n=1 Tax=Didymodactylos carnosus TaxID=1234261 RepID=A0A815FGJ8_9BILA|nr:unnamed protein product [Didymodactylos carnosus]CAF1324982.1 unnamed protein product [Didymodactylos carnosus]CAF3954365.1 unnamed protein product [Didymodactylos carnosus]CAF4174092.1 unnamed protein product [Didymodactylos carnosus]
MNNSFIFFLFIATFVTCTVASYLDIPAPPKRPERFKTRDQIEDYLKAVKDYYDAFKIKLVRRQNSLPDLYLNLDSGDKDQQEETEINNSNSGDSSDELDRLSYKTYRQHYLSPKFIPYQTNPHSFLRTMKRKHSNRPSSPILFE